MIIRVDSVDNLTNDVASCLNTTVQEMLRSIKKIDFNTEDRRGYDYLEKRMMTRLDEIYLCHVSRRLKSYEGEKLKPLDILLLTKNPFSSFLGDRDIKFCKDSTGEIKLEFNGKLVDWENNKNPFFNKYRFCNRLRSDYCVNGYQFLCKINKSSINQYRNYLRVPEFISDLDCLLNIGLVSDYQENSANYIALCRLKAKDVEFDNDNGKKDFEKKYLYNALRCIWENHFSNYETENPVLRALDSSEVYVEQWIGV